MEHHFENAKAYTACCDFLVAVSLGDLFGDWRNIDRAVAVTIVQESRHRLLFIISDIFWAQETRLVRRRQQPRPHPVCDHHMVLFLRYSLQNHNQSTHDDDDIWFIKKIKPVFFFVTYVEGNVGLPSVH